MSKVKRSLYVGLGTSLLSVLLLVVSSALLAGCAVGRNAVTRDTPVAARSQSAEPATSSPEEAQSQFWTQFDDPTLNQLVDDALDATSDLPISLAHLAEARAARHQALFDYGPTVT